MTLPQSVMKLQFMARRWKTTRKAVGSAAGLPSLAALDFSLMATLMGQNPTHALCAAHAHF